MRKSIKCGIAAAVVMAAGFAAYQTYGAYGAQDNSLLMQNIEALAGDAGGEGNSNKLPAHECYTYGEDTPGMYAYQQVKEYICSEMNFEFTQETAYNNQTKCSKEGYRRMNGVGDDHQHWCVYK